MTEFETECRARVGELRSAFIELYDSVGADPLSPQVVSRKFKVNKTLAWNVARLLQSSDPVQAIVHVPGASSLEKVIQATAKHGAGPNVVARARRAAEDFGKMIQAHAGDRPTLDLIVDGAGHDGDGGALDLSRKLAFRGNSGLYGVQARARLMLGMLAPNAGNPDLLDMVSVNGYVEFRRLRPNVRWPIFVVREWSDQDVSEMTSGWEPIEAEPASTAGAARAQGFPLIRSLVRGKLPEVHVVDTPEGRNFVLGTGPVGNEGSFDCFWGEMKRQAVPRFAERPADIGEFGAAITVPTEHLVADIAVHRDLEFALKPEVLVFGRIFPTGAPTGTADDPSLIPIRQSVVELPGVPPLVNTPHIPGYPELMRRIFERTGWNAKDFRGVRLTMKYPPLQSNILLRFSLPERPAR